MYTFQSKCGEYHNLVEPMCYYMYIKIHFLCWVAHQLRLKKMSRPVCRWPFFGTLSFSDALVYVSVPKYRTCKLQVLSASILMHRDDFGICLKPGHNLGTTASQQIVSALHTRLKYRIPILESWESPLKRECHFLFPKTGSISNSNLKFGVSLYSWRFMWFALILRHQTLSRNLH